jgi:hypothetical protein
VGDEIVSFAGRPIGSVNQFKNILGIYPKGWKLPLTYRREGGKQDVFVRLRALHRAAELSPERPRRPPQGQPPERRGPDDPEPQPGPGPIPLPRGERPAPPAEYADMFVKRSGFANYFFNQLERDRVLESIRGLGTFAGLTGLWTLDGRTLDGREFQFKLARDTVAVKIGEDVAVQPLDGEFGDTPPGSGGLLAALQAMKMLLVDPEGYFSEFYYVGTEPLDGGGERVDVLTTFRGQVTSRWYFRRADGSWVGFDTGIGEDVDECEIRIEELTAFSGRTLPSRFSVRRGDQPFATFVVEEAQLE